MKNGKKENENLRVACGGKNHELQSQLFRRGKWRKLTLDEKKKYKSNFDMMRKDISHWGIDTLSEYYEINNSEGNDRLILASRDDKGYLGVMIGYDIVKNN